LGEPKVGLLRKNVKKKEGKKNKKGELTKTKRKGRNKPNKVLDLWPGQGDKQGEQPIYVGTTKKVKNSSKRRAVGEKRKKKKVTEGVRCQEDQKNTDT